MCVFDIITTPSIEQRDQADTINNKYFTIDTADLITVHEWLDFNPYIVTHALRDEEVVGFFNIMPITNECAALFDNQQIKEEDLDIQHMLAPEVMHLAENAYLAAIAIKDIGNYQNSQCAAALLSAMCDHFLYGYDITKLKRIYANPTTFNGNNLVRKMGLKPVISHKKPLKGNDIYAMDITPETLDGLKYYSERYKRFICDNAWAQGNTTLPRK